MYAASLTALFSASALYHRPTWSPKKRALMRRIDHAAIYVLIAGTYTPVCAVAAGEDASTLHLLRLVWSGAAAGILYTIFGKGGGVSSKVISASIYIALGWFGVPYFKIFAEVLDPMACYLAVAGGLVYSLGVRHAMSMFSPRWRHMFAGTSQFSVNMMMMM